MKGSMSWCHVYVGGEDGEESGSRIAEPCPLSESCVSCCHLFQLENLGGEFTLL